MTLRFTALASGSSGNAAYVQTGGFGFLIDLGLGPHQLTTRLRSIQRGWSDVHAVLLTHTHVDHWKGRTFAVLANKQIPLFCHADHTRVLRNRSPEFQALRSAGLVKTYSENLACRLEGTVHFRPIRVAHDGGPTFGFRIDRQTNLFEKGWSLGYVADLGCWETSLVEAFANVDMLALEFNHDVRLQQNSGRPRMLIDRVLGEEGHLSNEQAAALVDEILARSTQGRLKHLIQLHLSGQCNRPELAVAAAEAVLSEHQFRPRIHTALQKQTVHVPLFDESILQHA